MVNVYKGRNSVEIKKNISFMFLAVITTRLTLDLSFISDLNNKLKNRITYCHNGLTAMSNRKFHS